MDTLLKREPYRYRGTPRWKHRTYPCRRWFCFRRSPSWRAFERGGKHYCDRHVLWAEEQLR